jgi:hypothetical protein
MAYLSDVNLRAVLTVLVQCAGGLMHVSNEELYEAMLPGDGKSERFLVTESPSGLTASTPRSQRSVPGPGAHGR